MTESRALRRRVTALAMIPATAGVFGVTVAWASAHDPLAAASSATSTPTEPALPQAAATPVDPPVVVDQRLLELNRQVVSAEARIADLRATLAAQAAAAAASAAASAAANLIPAPVAVVPAPAPAPAPVPVAPAPAPAPKPAPVAAPAPAPAPPPPVHVVTKASK